jgi:phosphatidylinositol alpha-1,6-mannosyltransferase
MASVQLLLTYDFPPMGGGIARWMGELARRYPPGALVVSTGQVPGSDAVDQQLANQVDRLPLPSSRLRSFPGLLRWSRRSAALASRLPIEFIWCGNLKPAAYPARWVKRRIGVPYGILLHGGELLIVRRQAERSGLKRRAATALLSSASVLVANSEYTTELCRSVLHDLGIHPVQDRLQTIPLGTDPLVFRPDLSLTRVRSVYGLDNGRWLLSVARLTRHKGIDVGIRALGRLRQNYPDLGYIVVGAGEDLPILQRLAHSVGVSDGVRFLGHVPETDLPGLYNCAEIYLGLSRCMDQRVEGFGIALTEASACGLPVIAGRTGGIPDAVRDQETGLLVDPDRSDEVTTAIRSLLDNEALRMQLGTAGRRRVETYYNWNRVTLDLARLGHQHGRRSLMETGG